MDHFSVLHAKWYKEHGKNYFLQEILAGEICYKCDIWKIGKIDGGKIRLINNGFMGFLCVIIRDVDGMSQLLQNKEQC